MRQINLFNMNNFKRNLSFLIVIKVEQRRRRKFTSWINAKYTKERNNYVVIYGHVYENNKLGA